MRVTVVIPTYNAGRFVPEAVASALAQTAPPAEVVVVDDGSTDDTPDRLAAFGGRVRVIRQANGGVSTARNAGVAAAGGDWVAFLDADDVWHPRKLEIQRLALARRPELHLLAAGTYPWPAADHPPVAPGGTVRAVTFDELVVRNQIVTSTAVVRLDALRAAGGFDPELCGPEDYDEWLRVARDGPVGVLDTPLAGYREVPGSLSRHAANMDAGMRRILGKLGAAGAFRGRPGLRRKAWAYYRYSAGYMHLAAGHRRAAAGHLALSLVGYPLPYPRADVRSPFGRARLLLAAARGRPA